MRVTVHQREGQHVTIKVEGKIAGPHVPVLHRAWQELAPTMGGRRLQVDLCGVTHVDEHGRTLLAEIHVQTRAEFVGDTPLTKYFAERAQQSMGTISDPDDSPRRQS